MKNKIKILAVSLALTAILFSCESNTENKPTTENKETAGHSHGEEKKEGSVCGIPLTPEDSTAYFNPTLEIKGEVENKLKLTVDSLKQMNVLTVDSFTVVCQSGATTSESVQFKGVLLKELLEKAKIIQHGHKDRNFYIVAQATDGYKATFSWAEIFNNPTGENTYVIFEENNAPIRKGAYVLNTTNDIKTGPRHVYWLKSIEVFRVN
ncbi:MAG: molybdopterin-dependent oxidoreductase [Flavobacteriales bacterium]|nr:molybdopterin-dependent oxidoreductase [Flavobacteriales bacterium]